MIDYSIQNNLIHWWRNTFCGHNIHEKATLSKNVQKRIRFVLFKIFRDNPPPHHPNGLDGFQFIMSQPTI